MCRRSRLPQVALQLVSISQLFEKNLFDRDKNCLCHCEPFLRLGQSQVWLDAQCEDEAGCDRLTGGGRKETFHKARQTWTSRTSTCWVGVSTGRANKAGEGRGRLTDTIGARECGGTESSLRARPQIRDGCWQKPKGIFATDSVLVHLAF
jgi:hypothetical protein